MPERKKRSKRRDDPFAAYKRLRSPMPPPQKILPDRRREILDEEARKEIEGR